MSAAAFVLDVAKQARAPAHVDTPRSKVRCSSSSHRLGTDCGVCGLVLSFDWSTSWQDAAAEMRVHRSQLAFGSEIMLEETHKLRTLQPDHARAGGCGNDSFTSPFEGHGTSTPAWRPGRLGRLPACKGRLVPAAKSCCHHQHHHVQQVCRNVKEGAACRSRRAPGKAQQLACDLSELPGPCGGRQLSLQASGPRRRQNPEASLPKVHPQPGP